MPAAPLEIDRLAPTLRPSEPAIGGQRWTNLLFLHWRVPAEALAPLVPSELTIDTFDGDAWVGLVPFYMSRVRPWWFFPVPGVSNFCETNVRTYVHRNGANPGVWFFSLEASRSLPVQVARSRWRLNYHRAEMRLNREQGRVTYWWRRLWPGTAGVGCDVACRPGDTIASVRGDFPAGQACPGTLEHFLTERYLLYTQDNAGRLLRGQVHHRPYPLREAAVEWCRDTLVADAGIPVEGDPVHALFSDGVDVKIYPLRPV